MSENKIHDLSIAYALAKFINDLKEDNFYSIKALAPEHIREMDALLEYYDQANQYYSTFED